MRGNNMSFAEGKQVRHIYTKESLWMLREGKEQILCRTRDLREIWFYPYELEDIDDQVLESKNTRRFL